MSKEIRLTAEVVDEVRREVCSDKPGYSWGRGEFRNSIFETLVGRLGLPWKTIADVGNIPDFDDPQVKELKKQLSQFKEVVDKGCSS